MFNNLNDTYIKLIIDLIYGIGQGAWEADFDMEIWMQGFLGE